MVEIDAAPAKDELTLRNNKAVVTIEGVRERLRVLLVSGAPHAGERVWRNLLKSDPSVDLVHFTILRPPEKSDGTPINELALIAFPQKELFEEKLHDFDLVIFDRFTNNITLPQRYFGNIADYVRGGGALADLGRSGIHRARRLVEHAARTRPSGDPGRADHRDALPRPCRDRRPTPSRDAQSAELGFQG